MVLFSKFMPCELLGEQSKCDSWTLELRSIDVREDVEPDYLRSSLRKLHRWNFHMTAPSTFRWRQDAEDRSTLTLPRIGAH